MRLSLLGLVVVLVVSILPTEAHAQIGGINDPFFAYYSFYLPRQQAQAMSPGPEATINAVSANRQFYASTNRNGMFDPNGGGFGSSEFGEGFAPNSGQRRRTVSSNATKYGVHGGNLNGLGPQGFYNGRLTQYYPNMRTGRGRNANVSVTRSRGYSGGFGGMGSGLPGPR